MPAPGRDAPPVAAELTWDAVLAWRMRRQLIEPIGDPAVADVVRALCGVQAQVPSSAELAIALRRHRHRTGEVADALRARELMRTWAMRGTLHLLTPDEAGSYLALIASIRAWERPSWQRNFGVTPRQLETLGAIVDEALDGRVLERSELIEEIAARTRSRDLDEHLRSGWGMVLKPLAWTGHLCNGPSTGGRVTFTTPASWFPEWSGLLDVEAAAAYAIPSYLRAFGPATAKAFDAWLSRGAARAADLKCWWAAIEHLVAPVDVEGERLYALASDVEELAGTEPTDSVRLLAGFDQYLLGPGTGDPRILDPGRRKLVSKAAGWIAPVMLARGRVGGVWELDGTVVRVDAFEQLSRDDRRRLAGEAERLGSLLGESQVSLDIS